MNRPGWRLRSMLDNLQVTLDINEVHNQARFADLYQQLEDIGQLLERLANSNDEILARQPPRLHGAVTPQEEIEASNAWIREHEVPGPRFGSGPDDLVPGRYSED